MERVLRQTGLKSVALLICLLSFAHSGLATTVIIPTDENMIIGARAIVRAKVLSVGSSFEDGQKRIFTYITLRVQEVLKGQITERKIVLKQLGGQVGDSEYVVFGSPRFEPGEKVIVYLDTWADGSLRVHQMFLGKFNIVKDPKTGQEMVVRSSPDENTAVLQNQAHANHDTSGTATERMELSAYLEMVRSKHAANLTRSEEFERTHYTGVPVLAQPAEYDAKLANGDVQAHFALLGPRRFFEPDSGQPVLFYVKQSGAPNPQVVDDVNAAMAAWSNVPGCALRVQVGGSIPALSCYAEMGVSGIVFDNCDGVNGPASGCASTLAWGGFYSFGGGVKVVNGTTFGQIRQAFVSFNPAAACHFTNHCNVQEIATHELGHALGLNHSQDSTATMAAFAHFDGRCASIKQDDIDGIKHIYPGTGGPGPLTITSGPSLPNGASSSLYSFALAAAGGTPPYTWALAPGSNLPPGLNLVGNLISGTPTSNGTFNFTLQVTDSAVPTRATAQKACSITVTAPGQPYDSQFVSQSVPTSVQPGQPFNINMKYLNTGTVTWNQSNFFLVTQNPAANTTWGGSGGFNAVSIGSAVIAQGQQLDVTFTLFAPATPGSYNFQMQTYRTDTNTFFGQASTNVVVQVGGNPPPPTPTNNAAFVSQTIVASMTAGQTQAVSVVMQNTGSTTWAAGTYKLGAQNPQDNSTWGLNRVTLASSVAPGGQATFNFIITAPATPGTYNFQWQMLQDGVGFFGLASTNVPVSVASGGGGGGGGTGDNATFISQLVPTTMNPGQTYQVKVTMKNSGTVDWTTTSGHKLGSQNLQDNMTWGLNRVSLSKTIPKGAQWIFIFNVKAPTTPGSYNFQWQMCKGAGFFGQKSANLVINVGGGGGGANDAAFVSQNVASSIAKGTPQVAVSVKMKNMGSTTWDAGTYKLGSQNPQDSMTWGLNRVNLGASVPPGGEATFNFNIAAPATPGTYNFQWQMLQDGVGFFGLASNNVAISVFDPGNSSFNDSGFNSQSVPPVMSPGQSYPVTITMTNNGTTTWQAGVYMLASQNPQENMTWGLNHVVLTSAVAPGSGKTFTFNVTAPTTPGTYTFQWQMMQGGVGFFGAMTPATGVSVSSTGTPPSITTTSLPNGKRNLSYSKQVTAGGGSLPYSWSLTGAPAGLSINNSTGLISGTPSVVGTFFISVKVTDSAGLSATRTYKVLFE